MRVPSGENFGSTSAPATVVSGRATPPSLGTSQRSPAKTKTISRAPMSG
jgi:hypothetical protein